MEGFLALLQRSVVDRQRWATREDLRLAIIIWIEFTYHRRDAVPAGTAFPQEPTMGFATT